MFHLQIHRRVTMSVTINRHCLTITPSLASSYHRHFDERHQVLMCTSQPIIQGQQQQHHQTSLNTTASSDGPVVVVCLLGWLGASWKHFHKFVDMYMHYNNNDESHKESHGLAGHSVQCLAHIPPIPAMFVPFFLSYEIIFLILLFITNHSSLFSVHSTHSYILFRLFDGVSRKSAKIYLDRLGEMVDQQLNAKREVKVVFHALSGNGISLLGHCVNMLQENAESTQSRNILSRTRCTIIDSAPPSITVDRFTRGFVGATKTMLGMDMSRHPVYEHWLLTPLFHSAFHVVLDTFGYKKRFVEFRHSVLVNQPPVPQLFLYSDADELIPSEDVHEFIADEKELYASRGEQCPPIHEHNFVDSGHVQHLRKYPQEYDRIVRQFIDKYI